MKKSLLALAVLGAFAGAASAQSSVTIYGIVDAGIVAESGNPAGSVTKLTSGVSAGSRLGFRGTEDLGGGMAAIFALETGILIDTGANGQGQVFANQNGLVFGRQDYVGLTGGFGSVTAGRQYNPYFLTVGTVDPFGAGYAGTSGNLMSPTGSNGRTNNSIQYSTPTMGGFSGALMYAFGEVVGDNSLGRVINGAVAYANGPVWVRLAYQNQNTTPTDSSKNAILAGSYDFGPAKLQAAYATAKGPGSTSIPQQVVGFNAGTGKPFTAVPATASTDARDFLIGVTVPFGANKVMASYIRRDDRTTFNQDANAIAVGYDYSLSKRTTLYAAYARISNKNGAAYTVLNAGDVTAGSGDKAFNLGVRHTF